MITILIPLTVTGALCGLWIILLALTDDSIVMALPGLTRGLFRTLGFVWLLWLLFSFARMAIT
jgi:hypothetical protein